ncbi:MAG TPA: STAS domain-containing protein, partial [Actinoplanes sp.]|nr:STAS domain-containing protein [Actinoplanes sp.]
MTTAAARRVSVEGELTISTAAEHKQKLLSTLHGDGDVLLDLSGVAELDTAGLQVLLLVVRESAVRGIAVRLRDPSPAVAEVLAIAQ